MYLWFLVPVYHPWCKCLYTIHGESACIPSMVKMHVYHPWCKCLCTIHGANACIPSMVQTPITSWFVNLSHLWQTQSTVISGRDMVLSKPTCSGHYMGVAHITNKKLIIINTFTLHACLYYFKVVWKADWWWNGGSWSQHTEQYVWDYLWNPSGGDGHWGIQHTTCRSCL